MVTRANAADGYPKPLTPLTQDLVITCENRGAHRFFSRTLGVLDPADSSQPFMLAFYGLVCINVDLIGGCGARLPGTTRRRLLENYFGFDPDPDLPEPGPVPSRLRTVGDGARVATRMIGAYRDFEDHIGRVRARVAASRPAAAEPSGDQLADWLERLFDVAGDAWVLPMIGGSLASSSLDMVRGQLRGDASERTDLCNRLHTGIGGNESAEAGLAARELARVARDEGLADELAAGGTAERLAASSPRFSAELERAIARFGYRGVSELELSRPSWRQDPDQLVDSVRRELDAPAGGGGGGAERVRAEAEAEAREALGRARYEALRRTLRITRRVLSLRENCKIPVVAAHDDVRLLLERAGPMLAERGLLPDPEAACLLLGSELAAALRGGGCPSAEEIAERRRAFEACQDVVLPEVMRVTADGLENVDEAFFRAQGMIPPRPQATAEGGPLSGIAAAPGSCTAVARVIDDPTGPEGDEFAPGDVLVASTVDPGWAPLLAIAGAVVLDIGGSCRTARWSRASSASPAWST